MKEGIKFEGQITGKTCSCLKSLIKKLVEKTQSAKEMHILTYNRSYPKTVPGPVPYPLCPVLDYDVGKVQKLNSLELYDYLTVFQYTWLRLERRRWF